jgi:hypothetical protein
MFFEKAPFHQFPKTVLSLKTHGLAAILFVLLALSGAVYFAPSSQAGQAKEVTAEQIAESAIAIAGNGFGRAVLTQIRRNGVEIGRETRTAPDGRAQEARYELRFVHGDKPEQDKMRLDSKTPQQEYSLVWGNGRLFGIVNGTAFTPRADVSSSFISEQAHSIDALLRYKENESKVSSAGKDKQMGVELYVLDLTDKANRKTRYFISARTFRILSLEYEETPSGSSTPVKYTKRFYDYRVAQGTQVPYRTVTLEDGKQTVEKRILTITFGVKMEDNLFQNPEAASSNP